MPIANCIVSSSCRHGATDLIALWARESLQSPEHMTVNIVTASEQFGNSYPVMATLWLPSLWSNRDVESLQLGLAKALSAYFNLAPGAVHVITRTVHSGMVVEDDRILTW